MNILKKKIDKFLNMPVDEEKMVFAIRLIVAISALILIFVSGIAIVNDMITDIKEKTGYTQVEGKVIECTSVSNNTIWSFIGIEENTKYKTIIEVDNSILESTKKEIYYLCKDKIDNNLNLNVKTYDGKMSEIEKIIDDK